MPTIKRFEDSTAWAKARELARLVYQASSEGAWSRDFALRDQIRRAAISILSNIAEGFERGGTREFRQFLSVAKGSVGEVQAQLYVALDAGFINEIQFRQLYEVAAETSRLVGGFIRYLSETEMHGPKYRELHEPELEYIAGENSELGTRNSGLGTRNSGLAE